MWACMEITFNTHSTEETVGFILILTFYIAIQAGNHLKMHTGTQQWPEAHVSVCFVYECYE